MHHRGALLVAPSLACRSKRSTRTTMPSTAYPRSFRRSRNCLIVLTTSSIVLLRVMCGLIGMPSDLMWSRKLEYVSMSSMPTTSPRPWATKLKRRRATTVGSRLFNVPAVELRALANNGSPSRSRSALMRSNSALGMKISPRTSNVGGGSCCGSNRKGIARIARTWAVMSSPRSPSPRVTATVNSLCSYRKLTATPSIFGSHTYSMPWAESKSDSSPTPLSTRSCQARRSAMSYVLSIDIIGTGCCTLTNPSIGSPPMRCDGLLASNRSGCAASSSISSRSRASYSESGMVGLSWTKYARFARSSRSRSSPIRFLSEVLDISVAAIEIY